MSLRFSPTRGAASIVLSSMVRGPAGNMLTLETAVQVITSGTRVISATEYGDFLVNVAGLVTFQFPSSLTRSGIPISVIDIGGNANSYNITNLPSGSELISGQASDIIFDNFAGRTYWPIKTGSGGWYLK